MQTKIAHLLTLMQEITRAWGAIEVAETKNAATVILKELKDEHEIWEKVALVDSDPPRKLETDQLLMFALGRSRMLLGGTLDPLGGKFVED